ncbi:hypothetical protein STENM327S_08737 [Streptomyces tendae]
MVSAEPRVSRCSTPTSGPPRAPLIATRTPNRATGRPRPRSPRCTYAEGSHSAARNPPERDFDSVPHAADFLSHTPTGRSSALRRDGPGERRTYADPGGRSGRRKVDTAASPTGGRGRTLAAPSPSRPRRCRRPGSIRATTLAAGPVLPVALATAVTEELRPSGLREPLTADIFSHRPFAHVPWLVMVDGLDEIPQRNDRIALLERLALAAEQQPGAVPVRRDDPPLAGRGTLPPLAPPPPTPSCGPSHGATCARTRADASRSPPDVKIHINEFMTGLKLSGLEALARTPLIASILGSASTWPTPLALCPRAAPRPTGPSSSCSTSRTLTKTFAGPMTPRSAR